MCCLRDAAQGMSALPSCSVHACKRPASRPLPPSRLQSPAGTRSAPPQRALHTRSRPPPKGVPLVLRAVGRHALRCDCLSPTAFSLPWCSVPGATSFHSDAPGRTVVANDFLLASEPRRTTASRRPPAPPASGSSNSSAARTENRLHRTRRPSRPLWRTTRSRSEALEEQCCPK